MKSRNNVIITIVTIISIVSLILYFEYESDRIESETQILRNTLYEIEENFDGCQIIYNDVIDFWISNYDYSDGHAPTVVFKYLHLDSVKEYYEIKIDSSLVEIKKVLEKEISNIEIEDFNIYEEIKHLIFYQENYCNVVVNGNLSSIDDYTERAHDFESDYYDLFSNIEYELDINGR